MFNENKPDVTLQSTLDLVKRTESISGKAGFSAAAYSDNSKVFIKDFTISEGTSVKYSSKLPSDTAKWTIKGSWEVSGNGLATGALKDLSYLDAPGLYIPGNPKKGNSRIWPKGGGSAVFNEMTCNDCTISADVKRDSTFYGFSIRFGITDDNNYFTLNISNPGTRRFRMSGNSSQGNTIKCTASIERIVNGTSLSLGNIGNPFDFSIDAWHNVKVTVKGNLISCSIDGNELGKLEYKSLQKQYAAAGYDNAAKEIIIKVVNGESAPFSTEINLTNAGKINPSGKIITLTSTSNKDDNNFAEPKKVSPVVSGYTGFNNSFKMEFKPNSFTILRIKASR
jgi:hypothetical protein